MAQTLYEQFSQIAASVTYDGTLDPAAVGESQQYLEGDMNVLRSAAKNIKGTTNWYDPPATTIAELNSRPNAAASFHLVPVQPIDGTGQAAVSGTAGNTYIALSGITSGTAGDSESSTTAGAFAAQLDTQSNFAKHNLAEVRKKNSRERLTTADGNDVYGFLQTVGAGALPATITGGGGGGAPAWVINDSNTVASNGNTVLTRTSGGNYNSFALSPTTFDAAVGETFYASPGPNGGDKSFGFFDNDETWNNGQGAAQLGAFVVVHTLVGGQLLVYFNGSAENGGSPVGTAADGDTLKLVMEPGGTVKLYKNGGLLHTFAGTGSGLYKPHVAIYGTGADWDSLSVGDGVALRVALKYQDNAGALQNYTLTAGDVADGGFDVVLLKVQALSTIGRYAFLPGTEFLDVAQDSEIGDLSTATGTYLGGATITSKLLALQAGLVADDTDISNLQTADDNLQTYTGSAGDTDTDPAYSSTYVVSQGSSLTTAIGALDTAHNDHLTDATDAHDASAISTTGIAGVLGGAASDVQAVLADLKQQIDDSSPAFTDTLLGQNYAPNDSVTVPAYTVGAVGGEYSRHTYNGTPLVPGASNDYVEVGTAGNISTTIQTKRSFTTGKYLTSLVLK